MEPDPDTTDRLRDPEVEGLLAALDDEYRARAIYGQVLEDFGRDVLPFANIVESEGRHIEALLTLFRRYGVGVPDDPWPGAVERYVSVADACRAGVEAEIENAALYERLFASTNREDVLAVYRNLHAASQQNHLPAFRRCAERQGPGRGSSRGDGGGGGRRWRGGCA